jgi:predicted esterase
MQRSSLGRSSSSQKNAISLPTKNALSRPPALSKSLKAKKKTQLRRSIAGLSTGTNGDKGNKTTQDGENGPIYHQQFLKATKPISKQDQLQYEQALQKHRSELDAMKLKTTHGGSGEVDDNSGTGNNHPADDYDDDDDDDDAPLTAEELFYEYAPLSRDLFEVEPRHHRGTLIWLPDMFETNTQQGRPFQLQMSQKLRVVVPNPPQRECTAVGGEEKRAWYDVMHVPFKPGECDTDYTGLKVSMYQLHQLIRDESFKLGEKLAPPGLSLEEVERIGAERVFIGGFGQGGALAVFAGLRYPQKLAGIVAHSGYIPFIEETIQSAKLLQENHYKEDVDGVNNAKTVKEAVGEAINGMEKTAMKKENGEKVVKKPFNLSRFVPNINAPLYVVSNQNDSTIPWLELAQPSFIKAISPPLQCKMTLRNGKSIGHSIASEDLFEMQYWATEVINKMDAVDAQGLNSNTKF